MPTTCAVIGCYNRQRKGVYRGFYRIPKEPGRRRRWLAFINHRNEDGKPWIPGNGDRVCSDHFISRKKSDIPTNPDYIPSVPVAEERRADLACARFERAQRRDMQKKDKEREAEQRILVHQQNVLALHHDHDYGVKVGKSEELIEELPREIHDTTVYEVGIPVEVGKFSFLFA